jgi:hypothetical protein
VVCADSNTAENCGLQTQVIILVVHIAQGQIHTFTQLAQALTNASAHSHVIIFQDIIIIS